MITELISDTAGARRKTAVYIIKTDYIIKSDIAVLIKRKKNYNRRRLSPVSTFYEGGGFYLRTSVAGINPPPTLSGAEAPGVC